MYADNVIPNVVNKTKSATTICAIFSRSVFVSLIFESTFLPPMCPCFHVQCSTCFLYLCINKPMLIIFNIVFPIFTWHLGPKIGNVWTKQALQAYLIFWLWQKHHLKPKPFCPGWTDLRLGFNLQNKLYLHFRLRCCLS